MMGEIMNPWLNTKPGIVLNLINKHYGYDFPKKYGISPIYAQLIFGKYIHYIRQGNVKNSIAGRQQAAKKISEDIFKEAKILFSPDHVYQLLQNGNAYLLKDLAMPKEKQGAESQAEILKKKVTAKVSEAINRGEEVASAIKSPFIKIGEFLKSPVTLAILGLGAGYLVVSKMKRGKNG